MAIFISNKIKLLFLVLLLILCIFCICKSYYGAAIFSLFLLGLAISFVDKYIPNKLIESNQTIYLLTIIGTFIGVYASFNITEEKREKDDKQIAKTLLVAIDNNCYNYEIKLNFFKENIKSDSVRTNTGLITMVLKEKSCNLDYSISLLENPTLINIIYDKGFTFIYACLSNTIGMENSLNDLKTVKTQIQLMHMSMYVARSLVLQNIKYLNNDITLKQLNDTVKGLDEFHQSELKYILKSDSTFKVYVQ